MPQEIIDVWMQHPTKEFLNLPMFSSLRRWMGTDLVDKGPSLESTIKALDEANVGLALLSSWENAGGPLISNDFVAECVRKYPNRLKGIAAVPLNQPMPAIHELRRCISELGFVALRIIQWLWEIPTTHRYYYPLFAECVNLDIPVCLQVGHTGPMMPSEVGRPIPYVDQVAIDFPTLKIVCGHIGYPWTQEMIAVATKHPNVYIDTSAYSVNRYPQELANYMRGHGNRKVLFGSNYPMITPAKCLEHIESLGLDEIQLNNFLFDNAKRVFNL